MTMFLEHYNYVVVIVLMMTGLYVVYASSNMIKKLVGLSVFQTSVFLLYISMGKVRGGQPPIIDPSSYVSSGHGEEYGSGASAAADSHGEAIVQSADVLYSNPLPHVLILTAIVVGVATLAIGLALVVRTREVYGTIEEDEIKHLDYQYSREGQAVGDAS